LQRDECTGSFLGICYSKFIIEVIAQVPSKKFIFTVKLPIHVVWSFMNNRTEVGLLFPGCKNITLLNDTDSLWSVSFSLGFFSRTIEIKGHTTELVEYERIAWTATHENLVTAGTITLRDISRAETEITYYLEGYVVGSFAFMQDIVFAGKFGELTRMYIHNIKKHLEKKAVEAAMKNQYESTEQERIS